MNPSNETNLRKIERASALFRAISTALLIPIVIVPVAATVSILAGWSARINYEGQYFNPSDLPVSSRLVLAVAVLLAGGIGAKALFHLRCLAGNYARREIFTTASARQIRHFGNTCMLWGAMKIAWVFLPLWITAHGTGVHSMSFDSILMGAVIVGISWFAEMAAALREESELTI